MQPDIAAAQELLKGLGGAGGANQRGSDVGACFQLALLAAGQGNDQEAGAYLRKIITAMKAMVQPGEAGAGAGPNT